MLDGPGCYFSSIEPQKLATQSEAHFLDQNGIFQIGKLVCRQIQGDYFDESFGDEVVKIMFYICRVLFLIHTSPSQPNATSNAALGDVTTKATKVLTKKLGRAPTDKELAKKVKKLKETAAVAEAGDDGEGEEKESHPSGLVWTFKQLAYHAKTEATVTPKQSHKRNCVFKIFAAVANFVEEKEKLMPFLEILLEPLYVTLADRLVCCYPCLCSSLHHVIYTRSGDLDLM